MYYVVEMAFGHHSSDGETLPKCLIEAMEYRGISTFAEQLHTGGQIHHCIGSYISTQGQLVIEPCTVIKAYTLHAEQCWTQLMTVASEIATELDQESVLLARLRLDGLLHWAKPSRKLHQVTQMQLVGL